MYQRKGFTLIELLVVVLIIGILSSVALPQYTKAVEKSRAAEALALMSTVRAASEVYLMSGGSSSEQYFCEGESPLDIDLPGTKKDGSCETKNFLYDGSCRGTSCRFRANRFQGENRLYSLHQELNSVGATWEFDCTAYSDSGLAVCKSLASQGWSMSDSR